jgi:hypothetical protein
MRKHLVIPDVQTKDGVPNKHLYWCGRYIAEKKPDVVVQIGDFADMESLSSYDTGKKSFEGRRYKKDIEATKQALTILKAGMGSFTPERMVLTLGNHEDRISRAIETDPKLEGTISLDDLQYEKFGWEVVPYLKPIKIDGVFYCHYFTSGPLERPCTSAASILSKHHSSCVAGHRQGRDIAYGKRADGKPITAIIAGSFYLHDEAYIRNNHYWRGIYMLHEVKNGAFDEMAVSIGYLERKYGIQSRVGTGLRDRKAGGARRTRKRARGK